MYTDDVFRPFPSECETLETGFGKNVLSRMLLINARPNDAIWIERTLQEDLAIAGPQGMLSLLRVLMALGEFRRHELLEFGAAICGPQMTALFEELLDLFEGESPRRDLWSRDQDGRYQLSYRAH